MCRPPKEPERNLRTPQRRGRDWEQESGGQLRLQKHFEPLSEQLRTSDGPVKSSLRKIASEVNTALVWIRRLSAWRTRQARLLVVDFPAASLRNVAQDQSGVRENSRFPGNGYGCFKTRKKSLARRPAAGKGIVGKLVIMVARLTREIRWF